MFAEWKISEMGVSPTQSAKKKDLNFSDAFYTVLLYQYRRVDENLI